LRRYVVISTDLQDDGIPIQCSPHSDVRSGILARQLLSRGTTPCDPPPTVFGPFSTGRIFMEAVMLKITQLLAAILAIMFMVAACNTMEGAGKDVKSVGQSIENSADKHK